MKMPEASVDEDHFQSALEHQIRFAWKVAVMKTVAIPHAMNEPADNHLRLRIPRAYQRHANASFRRRQHVHRDDYAAFFARFLARSFFSRASSLRTLSLETVNTARTALSNFSHGVLPGTSGGGGGFTFSIVSILEQVIRWTPACCVRVRARQPLTNPFGSWNRLIPILHK